MLSKVLPRIGKKVSSGTLLGKYMESFCCELSTKKYTIKSIIAITYGLNRLLKDIHKEGIFSLQDLTENVIQEYWRSYRNKGNSNAASACKHLIAFCKKHDIHLRESKSKISIIDSEVNNFCDYLQSALGYAPHTWHLGRKVLLNASKIVFISVALKKKFCGHVAIKGILPQIEDKFVVQPNGIDDYWIDHVQRREREGRHILYVGKFDSNKNIVRLIKAISALQQSYPDLQLDLVGGKGNQEKKVKGFIRKYPQWIHYHGEVYDKDVLRKIYDSNDIFAMPSIFETFGLVYIEALTQNLRLLYTKGQGIDGLFGKSVGESVNPLSVKDIRCGLAKLLSCRYEYTGNQNIDFELFRWSAIANVYKDMYLHLM